MRFIFVARPGADGATLRFLDQSGAPLFLELRD
jgi:hypothetical protein